MKRLILFLLPVVLGFSGITSAAQEPVDDPWKPFDYTEHLKTMYSGADLKYSFDNYRPTQWKKWQKGLRRELWTALGLDVIERNCNGFKPAARQLDSEDLGDCTREHWEIRTEPDVLLPMVIMRPKGLTGPVPLMITPHGHYKNTEVYTGAYTDDKEKVWIEATECDFAVQAVQHGFIAIAPTTRGFGKTRTRDDIRHDRNYSCEDMMKRDALVGRTPIGDRVWDMMRILDWALENLPVDEKNLIICGNSGGGTVSMYTSALDTRFTMSVPADYLCGFVESIGLIWHCSCNYVPGVMRLCEMGEIGALTAPRPICFINGAQDDIFPIEGTRRVYKTVEKVYQAAGVPDNCLLYAGPGGHRFFKKIGWDFILTHLNDSPFALNGLGDFPQEISIETIGNRVAEQFLASEPLDYGKGLQGYRAPYTYGGGKDMNYSVVSLWVNSIEFARQTGNKELEKRLIDFFEPFYGEKKALCNRDNHVDFSIFGAIPLEIYLMNGDKRALELGLRYADHQWENPVGNPGETVGGNGNYSIERQREFLADGYSPQTRLWIDDMYMITALQTQAYRATGDRKYIDRTAREMKMYMDTLQRPNGLFFHEARAPYFWGRGNGWMAAGLPMLLSYLPEDSEYRPALMDAYKKMMSTLLENQHENGMWGQVIDDPEFWEESSCSAMFAYAFIEGVKHGWLDEATYGPAVRKAWFSLCSRLDEYSNISDVCIGTNWKDSREWYMNRPRANGDPHGQMAMMWMCSAFLK